MGHHDAATIRQAVALLHAIGPDISTVNAGVSPALSTVDEVATWLTGAATHTARNPRCCGAGAVCCPTAGPALAHARRIIRAAEN